MTPRETVEYSIRDLIIKKPDGCVNVCFTGIPISNYYMLSFHADDDIQECLPHLTAISMVGYSGLRTVRALDWLASPAIWEGKGTHLQSLEIGGAVCEAAMPSFLETSTYGRSHLSSLKFLSIQGWKKFDHGR